MRHERRWCGTQVKTRYPNVETAVRAARHGSDPGGGLVLHVYACALCGGWHLTSAAPEEDPAPRLEGRRGRGGPRDAARSMPSPTRGGRVGPAVRFRDGR